ncbi:MAG: permease-like cell division protein FtsX [Pseudomonadaceae bacterium]|nr:permease-like cell division protein FtsX [Pseudomonadaceae bacterium]
MSGKRGNARVAPRQGKSGLPWPKLPRGRAAWLKDHRRVARESIASVNARIGTTFLVWLLIGIALALPSGLYLLRVNLDAVTADWQGRPGLTVYFQPGVEQTDIDVLSERLSQHHAISEVDVISPEAALEEFKALSGIDDALALLDDNPLPAALRGRLAAEAQASDLELAAALARSAVGVDDVVIERTWLARLAAISSVVDRLGLALALLFGLGAVLVTATSVRLAIENQLDELRVLKLVGASNAFMRRPFLYVGGLYGLGGALLAAMLISALLLTLEGPLARLVGSYGERLALVGFDPAFLGGLLLLGAGLGISGALVATRARLSNLDIVQ